MLLVLALFIGDSSEMLLGLERVSDALRSVNLSLESNIRIFFLVFILDFRLYFLIGTAVLKPNNLRKLRACQAVPFLHSYLKTAQ